MNKFDIIIFGARDWSNNWITQHRLAKTLSEKNHRVLFIENTGIRTAQIRDLPRILQRLKNWKKSIGGFRKISENLTVFSPLVLPFPYNGPPLVLFNSVELILYNKLINSLFGFL